MSLAKHVSFAEVVQGRESTVRITDDKLVFAIDLAIVVSGKSRNEAGMAIRRISETAMSSINMIERKIPGTGTSKTKLVTLDDALKLVMMLPVKVSYETRTKINDIIRRYMDGDESLVCEIQSSPEMTQDSSSDTRVCTVSYKRKLEDIELEDRLANIEMKKAEAQIKLAEAQAKLAEVQVKLADAHAKNEDTRAKHADTMAKTATLYTSLCPNQEIDERGRLLLKDSVLNSAMNGKLITNGAGGAGDSGAPAKDPNKFITISTVASELGYRFDTAVLIKIGQDVKREYENRYREEPPKHEQFVNGGVRQVCSYQERDRGLVEATIRRYAGAAKKA